VAGFFVSRAYLQETTAAVTKTGPPLFLQQCPASGTDLRQSGPAAQRALLRDWENQVQEFTKNRKHGIASFTYSKPNASSIFFYSSHDYS
jgi:hypothetical protein